MDDRMSTGQTPIAHEAIRNGAELRDLLRRAELAIADLKRATPDEAADIVRLIDAAEKAIPRLERQFSVELKAERTRLQTLEGKLRHNAPLLVQRAGAQRLQRLRLEAEPAEDEWWWRLDLTLAEQRQQGLRRLAIRAGAVAAVLLVLAAVYQFVLMPTLGPGPGSDRVSQAETYLAQGQLERALGEYTAAIEANPNDPELQAAAGAVLEQLGRSDEARPYLEAARAGLANEADYHARLSLVYYRMSAQGGVDAVAKAEEAALAAVAADDNWAMAHFALASVYELQGRVPEAIAAFDRASALTTDAALAASIRMRLGMLSQRAPELPIGTVTPEPAD